MDGNKVLFLAEMKVLVADILLIGCGLLAVILLAIMFN